MPARTVIDDSTRLAAVAEVVSGSANRYKFAEISGEHIDTSHAATRPITTQLRPELRPTSWRPAARIDFDGVRFSMPPWPVRAS